MNSITLDTSTEQLFLIASTALTMTLEDGSLNRNEEHSIRHHLQEIARHCEQFIDQEELTNRIIATKLNDKRTSNDISDEEMSESETNEQQASSDK